MLASLLAALWMLCLQGDSRKVQTLPQFRTWIAGEPVRAPKMS